eukprot:jgi/Hompol1/1464/HPOL_002711-RA
MPATITKLREALNTRVDWPRLALLQSGLQATLVSLLEAGVVVTVLRVLNSGFTIETNGNVSFISVYFSLFLFALWFQVALAIEGFYHQNSIQVISVLLLHLSTFMYSTVRKFRYASDAFLAFAPSHIESLLTVYPEVYQITNIKSCLQRYIDIVNSTPVNQTMQLYAGIYNFEHEANSICHFSSIVFNNDTQIYYPTVRELPPQVLSTRILQQRGNLDIALGLSYAIIAIMVVCFLAGVFLSFKTFGVYGWSVYQAQGADITKRGILNRYHVFLALMKINAYFFLGIFLQILMALYYYQKTIATTTSSQDSLFDRLHDARMEATYSAIGYVCAALIYFVLGYLGMRYEKVWAIAIFILIVIGYIVFGLANIQQAQDSEIYAVTRNFLIIFSVFHLILNIATLVSAVMAMLDFRRGLRQIAEGTTIKLKTVTKEEDRMVLD